MKVLITGSSNGIGKAVSQLFLEHNDLVIGLDKEESKISSPSYHHYKVDINNYNELPEIENVDILINNAGSQNSFNDIDNNLKSTIRLTEKYVFNSNKNNIKSILFNASSSAHTGFEFNEYCASKAGIIGYMKNVAWRVAKKYKATCNSISFGGVLTDLNKVVIKDKKMWERIMKVTPLKKWVSAEEAATYIYFLTVINKSITGQDILIDNGEKDLNCTFVWPEM